MTSSPAVGLRLDEVRSILGLAAPLAFVYLGNQLLSVVDTAVVGRFSEVALAFVLALFRRGRTRRAGECMEGGGSASRAR